MKITLIKDINVSNPRIEMTLDLDEIDPSIQLKLKFTCPECTGHGCRAENRDLQCLNGTVTQIIEPGQLDKMLECKSMAKVKVAINKLNSSVNNNQYQAR